eukprot:gnl/Dysnectes_brevis/4783_a6593_430.p1 GENE.gnl/Dysnectes_brevis/4783_a6593_430~~gnl/Dysnectes_brevis/4783_a6593_430.p1  ORF type:complete len:428 (-),score=58.84 gnl/Dysnectes_brevis/4783_a6593_430:66-1349(-)
MRLKQVKIRYYPPGILLSYLQSGHPKTHALDFLDFTPQTNPKDYVEHLQQSHRFLLRRKDLCTKIAQTLHEKQVEPAPSNYVLSRLLKSHLLPITTCAFNKTGDRFLTASHDRTAKVWDTQTGEVLKTLEGHDNTIFAVAFDYPYSERILTGSFDKTARLWNANTGEQLQLLSHHTSDVLCVGFSPLDHNLCVTAGADATAAVWDLTRPAAPAQVLGAHTQDVVTTEFCHSNPSILLTGSFDKSARLWDVRTGSCVECLTPHELELTAAHLSHCGRRVLTGSADGRVVVIDLRSPDTPLVSHDHGSEVLDAAFDAAGRYAASGSSEGAVLLDVAGPRPSVRCHLKGHLGEVGRVKFLPQGSRVVTSSADRTLKVWSTGTAPDGFGAGECLQTLEGHLENIHGLDVSYSGDVILSASSDYTCRLWTCV